MAAGPPSTPTTPRGWSPSCRSATSARSPTRRRRTSPRTWWRRSRRPAWPAAGPPGAAWSGCCGPRRPTARGSAGGARTTCTAPERWCPRSSPPGCSRASRSSAARWPGWRSIRTPTAAGARTCAPTTTRPWRGAAPPPRRRPRGRCWRCSRPGVPGRPWRPGCGGSPSTSEATGPGTSPSSPGPVSRVTSTSTTTSTGSCSRSARLAGTWRGRHEKSSVNLQQLQAAGAGPNATRCSPARLRHDAAPGAVVVSRRRGPACRTTRLRASGTTKRAAGLRASGTTSREGGRQMSTLLVCSPLRLEARAVRRGLPVPAGGSVRVTGYGPARSRRQAQALSAADFGVLAIAGVGGGLTADLAPGDLVVGTEVSDGHGTTRCAAAPLLAGELRRAGLRAVAGPVVTVDRLAGGAATRQRLAAGGALLADMESAPLAAAAGDRPVAVLRAVSDTPARPLLSPRIVTGGLAALRAASPVLARWAGVAGPRRVLLAGPRSFCAGVERAIEIVEKVLGQRGAPVYVRKQIVHNTHVVADLERRGAVFVDELSEVPDGACVVFSAHGVSPAVRAEAARRGLDAIDATCPLVSKVHAEARRFAAEGYLVALIGHAGRGAGGDGPGGVRRRRGQAAPGGPGQGGLPDADHAGRGRGRRRRRGAHRAVPGGPGARQRRHLLRHHQPAAGDPYGGRRVRPGAGGRLGQLLQLGAPGRDGRASRHPGATHRRAVGHPARLAGRRVHGRPDRRRVGAAGRGRGHHHGAVGPGSRRGFRARHHHREHPVQPAQGGALDVTLQLSTVTVTPQPPGRTPHSAGRRASGATPRQGGN